MTLWTSFLDKNQYHIPSTNKPNVYNFCRKLEKNFICISRQCEEHDIHCLYYIHASMITLRNFEKFFFVFVVNRPLADLPGYKVKSYLIC